MLTKLIFNHYICTLLALIFPLLVRYITGKVLVGDLTDVQSQVVYFGL
ncbi:MAG: hypothetical protein JJU16_03025 [Alkalibacterium sp.]|nr:hypothetical protein [Alkalibacterium sp.]